MKTFASLFLLCLAVVLVTGAPKPQSHEDASTTAPSALAPSHLHRAARSPQDAPPEGTTEPSAPLISRHRGARSPQDAPEGTTEPSAPLISSHRGARSPQDAPEGTTEPSAPLISSHREARSARANDPTQIAQQGMGAMTDAAGKAQEAAAAGKQATEGAAQQAQAAAGGGK